IDIIAEAAPKRDYYYLSPLGRRLFQFALGPAALAFIGAGSKEDVLNARRMIVELGEGWPAEWLRARSLGEWGDYLDGQLSQEGVTVERLSDSDRQLSDQIAQHEAA